MVSTLVAHLAEVVNKIAFGDFYQKNIIEPLELKNAGFNVCNPDMSKTAKQYSTPENFDGNKTNHGVF